MKRILAIVFSIVGLNITLSAQFKNDNVLYRTVDPAELCKELQKNKDALILDVRSKGEHYDTSSFVNLNLGHLKGAKNIDVNTLGVRLSELQEYRDKPIFVYCSHSQRSRRASKMLADSGFTKVYNVNGGLSAFHYKSLKDEGCLNSLYETANAYKIISFNQLCSRVKAGNPFILDVRPDSAFRHIAMDAKANALGTIKGTVNIPYASLKDRLTELPAKNAEIIITDLYAQDASRAAVLLKNNGYENVSLLIEGVDRILNMDAKDLDCKDQLYVSPVSYRTFNATEFARYAKKRDDLLLLDVRTADEFANKHKDAFRNIGNMDGAVNIPADELEKRLSEIQKDRHIVVYGFGGGPEVFRSANILSANGYKNVHVLAGGLFGVRWSAGNVKGQGHLKDLVVNVPEINQ